MTHDVPYTDRGVRAAVILHDREMRAFLPVWRRALAQDPALPVTEDRAYASLGALGRHVLGAGRGYVTWVCRCLELPDPGIPMVPDADGIVAGADAYMEDLLSTWATALTGVPSHRLEEVFQANWGTPYSIDAMLEHAVMHPLRHRFQLEELLDAAGGSR
jgi:hypothetical protein